MGHVPHIAVFFYSGRIKVITTTAARLQDHDARGLAVETDKIFFLLGINLFSEEKYERKNFGTFIKKKNTLPFSCTTYTYDQQEEKRESFVLFLPNPIFDLTKLRAIAYFMVS